ncbi:MAG: adenylosuccinate synthetase [Polyangiaceae bacterium]|nr:adenylosuccinate synthetase [Polyangiaceae bacterium]
MLSKTWVVVDLAFGDAGKGTITDFLVRETGARLVVRFNGGAQAGHTVVTDDGRVHTFSQFGAGTFVPGVRTHLAEPVIVHPSALLVEARHLERVLVHDALDRLTIAESARVITPFHQAANRARELARGNARHGTCGVGVGETVRDAMENPDDAIYARDLNDAGVLLRKLGRARERLRATLEEEFLVLGDDHRELAGFLDWDLPARWVEFIRPVAGCVVPDEWLFERLRESSGDVVFEGAQGVLLDENVGFHPHTTWSDCTPRGALALLRTHGHCGEVRRIGVLRTYLTRHGEGPFPTETPDLGPWLPEPHNDSLGWQGAFRVGYPDFVLTKYAMRVCGGVDALAVTHCDRIELMHRIAVAYENASDEALFVHDGQGRAMDLREGDLARQERLGNALREVRPIWEDAAPGLETRIEQLEAALGVRVAMTSAGPAARDKVWRGR